MTGPPNIQSTMWFQSTHPQGGRPYADVDIYLAEIGFNPRTRRGCDNKPGQGRAQFYSFNPRTRRGCD